MLKEKRYNHVQLLGDRAAAIPGPEPVISLGEDDYSYSVCEPSIGGREQKYVMEAIQSGWVSSQGPFIQKFEALFAKKMGAKHAVTCNSGTSALMLTMAALGIGPGDEVIVPTFTMISSVNAFTFLGAKPVFVDCDCRYQMRADQVESLVTENTKAILPVHIYGHPVDIDAFDAIGASHGIPVIYDSAEAHGATYKGWPLGNFGLANCYSFYGNKIITTGEGGMVTTDDKSFADLIRTLRDVGFSKERHFWHKRLGYNFRMTNLQAALGLAQTERLDELVAARKRNREHYEQLLNDDDGNRAWMAGARFQPQCSHGESVHWMVGLEIDGAQVGIERDKLREAMAKGRPAVETRTYFVPMHLQPLYWDPEREEEFPEAERLSTQGLYLPSSSHLTDSDREEIIQMLVRAVWSKRTSNGELQ